MISDHWLGGIYGPGYLPTLKFMLHTFPYLSCLVEFVTRHVERADYRSCVGPHIFAIPLGELGGLRSFFPHFV